MTRKSSISTGFYINKKFNYHSFKDNSSHGNYKLGNFLEQVLRENLCDDISFDIPNNSNLNINFLIKKRISKITRYFSSRKIYRQFNKRSYQLFKIFS